jgi:hypothetical protein
MDVDDYTNGDNETPAADEGIGLEDFMLDSVMGDDMTEEEINTIAAYLVCQVGSDDYEKNGPARRKPVYRDREASWNFIMTWNDEVFRRQFRMDKDQFIDLVDRCKRKYPGKSECGLENYRLSQIRGEAGSISGPIILELKVALTLRLLAGASYLDMIWYGVALATVPVIFRITIYLMDLALTNEEFFNFPDTEEKFAATAKEWSDIMVKRRGRDLMCGTLFAGDGLVVHTEEPTEKERQGMDVGAFRNRKGCFGLICQAFCDAECRFRYWDVQWPGATPDITCYKQTALYNLFTSLKIPNKYHMVLDEAYGSIGGDQHLVPYSKSQLQALTTDDNLYLRMKAFNHILSSQRITIERAFGMFVRKWGIFWKPLSASYGIELQCQMLRVAAKLHNMCIDYRLSKKQREEHTLPHREPEGVRMGPPVWRDNEMDDSSSATNENVRQQMNNYRLEGVQRACRVDSERRSSLRECIHDAGFFYNHRTDLDFTLTHQN